MATASPDPANSVPPVLRKAVFGPQQIDLNDPTLNAVLNAPTSSVVDASPNDASTPKNVPPPDPGLVSGTPDMSAEGSRALENDPISKALAAPPPTATAAPELAHQGPANKFLSFFSHMTGQSAPSPAPGQPYTGPTTPEEKHNNMMNFISRFAGGLGSGFALAGGTPEQREIAGRLATERPELAERAREANLQASYMAPYRAAQAQQIAGKNPTELAVAGIKAHPADIRAQLSAMKDGYMVGPDGKYTVLSPDFIKSNPIALAAWQLTQQKGELAKAQAAYESARPGIERDKLAEQVKALEAHIVEFGANYGLHQEELGLAVSRLGLESENTSLAASGRQMEAGKRAGEIWAPAQDSSERLQVMRQNYQDGLRGDQQAMLSLLANHLGMTMGLQRGARLNQAIISEAQKSMPWLQGIKARFDKDGYLTGVVLSPEQMQQMVDLGSQRYRSDVQKARNEAQFEGFGGAEPQLAINPETGEDTSGTGNSPLPSIFQGVGGGAKPKAKPKAGSKTTYPPGYKPVGAP